MEDFQCTGCYGRCKICVYRCSGEQQHAVDTSVNVSKSSSSPKNQGNTISASTAVTESSKGTDIKLA